MLLNPCKTKLITLKLHNFELKRGYQMRKCECTNSWEVNLGCYKCLWLPLILEFEGTSASCSHPLGHYSSGVGVMLGWTSRMVWD
jgi:hypothetical protein